ncbi:WD40 repeat-like protein [Teratosphaeria nubilosa]|uniref:WD40 repeat-like protein n=1 Tax=Teratosphaeria nubilosa TaxID=161662 RepID=A0A6G1L377_9PEZI|nr:WD40 repeat-like protein [Teratosphaeria nubilosa]
MARKARQRISYVLPLANSAGGHRLGVNGLAVDSDNSLLYSGGRDGVICAWDLHLDPGNAPPPEYDEKISPPPATTFRQQVQAHTHWINDIALAQSNQALVSASSDITVKVWRPTAQDRIPPQSIGLHSDYVKTLAVPSQTSDWVVSGGLDRKIGVWDLSGAGQKLCINVGDDEAGGLSNKDKGSVYALAATNNVLASGGPEGTVRVWDARTGKRITKLVGHTDNIRDVLVSQDGSTIMTASSDRTVKVWSTTAGRCMFTLTMHDASVWSLFSSDPDLSVFYSSDKSGLVAKTDTRNVIELDEGISVAVAQEHEGVHKVVAANNSIWTATSRPSINRWRDVNTEHAEIDLPESYDAHRMSVASAKSRYPGLPNARDNQSPPKVNGSAKRKIPLKHVLRLSNTAYFPAARIADGELRASIIDGSKDSQSPEAVVMQPVRPQPEYSIEGQNGLIKHVMLNDRIRVLTLDTAGEVMMWDLLKCVPIRSFGKRHLEDVQGEVTTMATVANWCAVDTRTGSVTVVLEENTCFDAEMYADELELDGDIDFREDQRINLGKWVVRYLFSNLITEEIQRDQAFRNELLKNKDREQQQRLQRENAPTSIQLPTRTNGWHPDTAGPGSATTPRALNGAGKAATPGFGIGAATPGVFGSPAKSVAATQSLLPTTEEGESLEKRLSKQSEGSIDRNSDYFSTSRAPNVEFSVPGSALKTPVTPSEGAEEATTPGTEAGSRDTPSKQGLFGKKFRSGMSFGGMKKLGRTSTSDKERPNIVEEKGNETESDSRSSKTSSSRVVEDNFLGTVQKIRHAYEDSLQTQLQNHQAHENGLPGEKPGPIELPTAITPSMPSDTPVLKPPPNTTILIQEDRPEAGGVADLFEGTVGTLGEQCDQLERVAPMWLGDVLLKNQIPIKDIVKISFILEPYQGSGLPGVASDGNNRLNANRMLRAKKILAYIAERIEPMPTEEEKGAMEAEGIPTKPEEYLELWCQNQIISPKMTLATIRSHIWRGGGDVLLYYKPNGKKQIKNIPPQQLAANIPVTPKPTAAA